MAFSPLMYLRIICGSHNTFQLHLTKKLHSVVTRHAGHQLSDHRPCVLTHGKQTALKCTVSVESKRRHGNQTTHSAVGFDDYQTERKNFKLTVPKYFNFATNVIDQWAEIEKTRPRDYPAFWWIDDDGFEFKWSFQQLSDKSKRAANVLTGPCGLKRGDRVLVILPRVPEWWLMNIAAIRAGLVLIPGTTQLTVRDIKHRLLKSKAKGIVVTHDMWEELDKMLDECPEVTSRLIVDKAKTDHIGDKWETFVNLYNSVKVGHKAVRSLSTEPMTLFFTSGTTGPPKMTEHTHASYGVGHLITGRYWLDLTPHDVHWCMSDTGWAKSAWSNFFAPWIQGSCIFVHHSARFDPQRTMEILEKYPITTFCTAPTGYRLLIQEDLSKYQLRTLRHCVSAGEPLNPEVIESWQDMTRHTIREGYGQTESVLMCANFHCIPQKLGSMGKPAPGIDLTVINANAREAAVGEEGDMAVRVKPSRPPWLFTQYVDEPDRTAAAFRGNYYLTGDRACKDEDGYFWFVGRSDDVILSAGYRIGPFEVESALIEHPAVAESAVVSSPDKTRGEVVKAFIILTQKYLDADQDTLKREIQDHVKSTTAPYKYPRKIEFTETLPKTVSGKIRRIELRNHEWGKTMP